MTTNTSEGVPIPESRVEVPPLPENVALTIFFSSHRDKEDLGDFFEFRRKVRSSDIFIPEAIGWNSHGLDLISGISKGERAALDTAKKEMANPSNVFGSIKEFNFAYWEALYASNRTVAVVDLKEKDPRLISSILVLDGKKLYGSGFEDALVYLQARCRDYTQGIVAREAYICSNLGPELERTINANPKLKGKETVKVFMMLGSLHTSVGDLLSRKADEQRATNNTNLPRVEVEVPEVPEDEDPSSELVKHYHPNIVYRLSPEQMRDYSARVCATDIISTTVKALDLSENLRTTMARVSALSIDEIEQLFVGAKDVVEGPGGLRAVLETNATYRNMFEAIVEDSQRKH